jgi:hypothetical protein
MYEIWSHVPDLACRFNYARYGTPSPYVHPHTIAIPRPLTLSMVDPGDGWGQHFMSQLSTHPPFFCRSCDLKEDNEIVLALVQAIISLGSHLLTGLRVRR